MLHMLHLGVQLRLGLPEYPLADVRQLPFIKRNFACLLLLAFSVAAISAAAQTQHLSRRSQGMRTGAAAEAVHRN
ncbi:MAG TPA: hypothetical protein VE133_07330, partial [Candidatus Sulfotelmatobacter sp.]|nr:hypothetical protein [Candidatus Sulfotelmatobacter sp.]